MLQSQNSNSGEIPGNTFVKTSKPRTCYIGDMSLFKDVLLQWDCVRQDDAIVLTCSGLTGRELLCLYARSCDLAWETHKRIVPGICVTSYV